MDIGQESTLRRGSIDHSATFAMNKVQEGYEFSQKIVVYDRKSLYLFHHKTTFRRVIVGITEAKAFEMFILFLISINSAGMLMYDYKDRENKQPYNQGLERVMNITTWLFICEALLKIIAQSFWFHKNAYLRDSWNCMDAFVVFSSILEMTLAESLNMRFLRTLRVFRPLRSINQCPAMKRLVESLGHSLASLTQAISFMGMVLLLFAMLGVKQFQGVMYQRCRDAEGLWVKQINDVLLEERVCSMWPGVGY